MRWRVPPPLPCAVLVAIAIAVCGTPRDPPPPGAIPDDHRRDRITGVVRGPIVRTQTSVGAVLDTGESDVWLWSRSTLEPGERITATGRLHAPRGLLDPGAPDRAVMIASRGAHWELHALHVQRHGRDDDLRSRTWRWASGVQASWAARIDASDAAGAALRGIITGDRAEVPTALDDRWRAVGIFHVLSVSGLHLAVLAGLAYALLRRLVAASPWGGRVRPARWAAPIALVLATAYTLVTGAQIATLRALIVLVAFLAAQMLDRPMRPVDALGIGAIAILVWRPHDLYDPSFQLSFVAALTLAVRARPAPTENRLASWLANAVSLSWWVTVATAPLTAYHFQQVAIGGLVGNLVLTPIVELTALPLGLAGVLLGDLGAPLVSLAVSIVGVVDAIAELLARGLPIGRIAIASPLVMAVLVVLALGLASRRHRTRLDKLGWLAVCAAWLLARTPPPVGALRVTFLDVGQGDAALVEMPGGQVWLVDAGGRANAGTVEAAASPGRAIASTLAVYGHDAIDVAIISHPHPDHYMGLVALDVPIRELWFVPDDAPVRIQGGLPSFASVAATLVSRGTRLVHPELGTVRMDDGVEIDLLAPRYQESDDASPVLAADPVRGVNDNSLVIAVRYAGRSLLFTGDLEAEGEDALVTAGLAPFDVVKVAHHGSKTSSAAAFVAATRPAYAVISCGVANPFSFPAPAVVARWLAVGARVERTDVSGAITVTVSPDGRLGVARIRP